MLSRNNELITVANISSAIDIILYSLSSASKRQYEHTYKLWNQFARLRGWKPSEVTAHHVIEFLEASEVSHRTQQARLSHLRKLVHAIYAEYPDNLLAKRMYEGLKLLKLKRTDSEKQSRRAKVTLTSKQVHNALDVFADDTKVHTRNRAMLAILLYCGVRRSELVALQWQDINLDEMLITVEHGKGDKSRTIPILGGHEYIQAWHIIAGHRTYVFSGMAKGDKFGDDKPMTTHAVYKVISKVQKELNLDKLSPHDFRRTLITNAIEAGTPLNIVQGIAGHENSEMTMEYAKKKDAKAMRTLTKLTY